MKHGRYGYVHHGCRCDICTAENREWCTKFRREHFATRVLVDGRLTATGQVVHGSASTYTNYGCRCVPCCDAHRARMRRYKAERKANR